MANQNQSDHDLLVQIAGDQRVLCTKFESYVELMEERCKHHHEDTARLKRTMSGNGWMGIKTRVEIMWYSFGAVSLFGTGWLLYKMTRG